MHISEHEQLVAAMLVLFAVLFRFAVASELTWRLGEVDTDCDTACEDYGGICDEGAWPTSLQEWQTISSQTNGLECKEHMSGGWAYNPAICIGPGCAGICFWEALPAGKRCSGGTAAYPSGIARRACPCRSLQGGTGMQGSAHTPAASHAAPVYSMIGEHEFRGNGECFDADAGLKSELPLASSPYTIEAWVQPEEVSEYESFGIVGWGNPAYSSLNGFIFFRGSHSLRNIWWQNDLQAYLEKPLADGQYHHVAATWDGSSQKIFVDFEEVASRLAEGYDVQSKVNFCIGMAWHQDGSRAGFRGKIKDLKIWNSARTAQQLSVGPVAPAAQTALPEEVAVPAEGALPAEAAVKALVLEEHEAAGSRSFFEFQAPADGCYMIEERHPHTEERQAVPLTVNFCKGLQAHGFVNHADGRHDQWNYLASLPFFVSSQSTGVLMPLELTQKSSMHGFRFTHLGASCHRPSAKVEHAELQIKADLTSFLGQGASFKIELSALLTSELQLRSERLTATHIGKSSVEVMVRPAAVLYEGRRLKMEPSAGEAITLLEAKLQADAAVGPTGLATKICKLAGKTTGCTVAVTSLGTVTPQVHFGSPGGFSLHEPERMNSMALAIGISVAVASVLIGMLAAVLYRRRTKITACEPSSQEEQESQKGVDLEKSDDAFDDTASTVTPSSLEDGLANLKDIPDPESRSELSVATEASDEPKEPAKFIETF
eukprot:TRINITY_DN25926_c0_g1_i1.p1 TRINITY_DN25926_c0_g1~~TRINITY_DN25926_c0_g1_i1.p1  ORF type:complete len:715 (-),score=179.28 TRINITY_DN25926_c0_g1_i1:186-2330(-)